MTKIRSIFLSSESQSSLPLVDFCRQHELLLVRKSLISFAPVAFEFPENWEVVFFASPRAVDFFLSADFLLKPYQQLACIGSETKKHIESRGYTVSFSGELAGKPDEIAQEFKAWLGERIALFPQSTKSNKSIEAILPEEQKVPLVVYETIEKPGVFDEAFSVYVFTSPSNLLSFLSQNSIPEDSKVIAWGDSTARVCLSRSVQADYILSTSTYAELEEILQKIIV